MLRWVFISLIAFIAVGAVAMYTDFTFRGELNEWRSAGFTEIPLDTSDVAGATLVADLEVQNPDEVVCNEEELATSSVVAQGCRSIDTVFAYALREGIDCLSLEDLASLASTTQTSAPGCDRIADLSRDFEGLNDRSNILTFVIVLLLIATAFPFSSFIHRTSRNLRALKSEGQKHSPDGTVIRFFVPVLNVYKPLLMVIELFKASDQRVPDRDGKEWQKKGGVAPIAVIWGLTWGAAVIFNPVTVARVFFRDRSDLGDVATTTTGLIAADILIVVLGILAILMTNTLSHWQDARAAKYGTVTVTPPRPRDPMEKALEEGIRRTDHRTGRVREHGSKRRRK